MKTKKLPKVKINKVELSTFSKETLIVDPYWEDLYNPPVKPKK
jgi:hypothetical protein